MIKIYPSKVKLFRFQTPLEKKHDGVEPIPKIKEEVDEYGKCRTAEEMEVQRLASIRKTKTKIRDIVECNKWELWILLTFDPKKVAQDDHERGRQILKNWLDKQQKLYGKMEYILVPEEHKSGALHFHILLNGFKGKLTKATNAKKGGTLLKTKSGKQVWIVSSWNKRYGYGNGTYVDNHPKLASYMTKYITKDMPHNYGKKRYWASKGVKRPQTKYNTGFTEADGFKKVYERAGEFSISERTYSTAPEPPPHK